MSKKSKKSEHRFTRLPTGAVRMAIESDYAEDSELELVADAVAADYYEGIGADLGVMDLKPNPKKRTPKELAPKPEPSKE